ncbi:hypothetical protein [Kitasatospora sp. NPDC007106]|uniref:hypothetical protein n=1 Tax=Kitasatospora sp. NPDC007106 TaxID=3156914 RepID=UPI0034062BE3
MPSPSRKQLTADFDADLRDVPLQLHGLVVNLFYRPVPKLNQRPRRDQRPGRAAAARRGALSAVTVGEAGRFGQTVETYAPDSEVAEVYRMRAKALGGAWDGAR